MVLSPLVLVLRGLGIGIGIEGQNFDSIGIGIGIEGPSIDFWYWYWYWYCNPWSATDYFEEKVLKVVSLAQQPTNPIDRFNLQTYMHHRRK